MGTESKLTAAVKHRRLVSRRGHLRPHSRVLSLNAPKDNATHLPSCDRRSTGAHLSRVVQQDWEKKQRLFLSRVLWLSSLSCAALQAIINRLNTDSACFAFIYIYIYKIKSEWEEWEEMAPVAKASNNSLWMAIGEGALRERSDSRRMHEAQK